MGCTCVSRGTPFGFHETVLVSCRVACFGVGDDVGVEVCVGVVRCWCWVGKGVVGVRGAGVVAGILYWYWR